MEYRCLFGNVSIESNVLCVTKNNYRIRISNTAIRYKKQTIDHEQVLLLVSINTYCTKLIRLL